MRFRQFLEMFPDITRPAIVRKADNVKNTKNQQILKVVEKVRKGLLSLFNYGGRVTESYSANQHKLEPILFSGEYIKQFLSPYGINPKSYSRKSCGTEGCAYFYDEQNLVLKATNGENEYEIATRVKGKTNLFPVIDTGLDASIGVYLILSQILDTAKVNEMVETIDAACWIIRERFNSISVWRGTKEEIDNWLDFEQFKKFAHDNFSSEYSGAVQQMADEIFKNVVEIYGHTNHFVTNDVRPSNLGFAASGKPQIFDYGYSSSVTPIKAGDIVKLTTHGSNKTYTVTGVHGRNVFYKGDYGEALADIRELKKVQDGTSNTNDVRSSNLGSAASVKPQISDYSATPIKAGDIVKLTTHGSNKTYTVTGVHGKDVFYKGDYGDAIADIRDLKKVQDGTFGVE